MSASGNANEAHGLPPPNTFPASGANPIGPSSNSTAPPAQPSPSTSNAGTQTTNTPPSDHRASVSFSSRIEVRGPDGTTTYVPVAQTSATSSSSGFAAAAQPGSEGPPNEPPSGNPPAVAASASPGEPGDQSGSPPAPPPNGPSAAPAAGGPGQPGANPLATMNQAAFVFPGNQPFLWVNPPIVSSSAAPVSWGYRSTQQSPYWPNTSHWLTNPPQQYMYVAGCPTYVYATAGPVYTMAPNTAVYYI
ncbi:hypothetical protein DL766_008390 [Monosporascus sp. MC13-8B]|uniref:Uncharacterized protein n=1 Tax=Monosporascus cannonballus TaxID=155416 RepID=A0ABY0HAK0_9PEZI|nr:hypothetical protein DL763_010345 [Monosporascus cannonballus]RYO89009.1 hypothetical protein DL762_003439 [Monosporascus cannonballus]RYP19612.1 hypothetical protein DL766_008390 [Monosporascus sp. MC13-8B]